MTDALMFLMANAPMLRMASSLMFRVASKLTIFGVLYDVLERTPPPMSSPTSGHNTHAVPSTPPTLRACGTTTCASTPPQGTHVLHTRRRCRWEAFHEQTFWFRPIENITGHIYPFRKGRIENLDRKYADLKCPSLISHYPSSPQRFKIRRFDFDSIKFTVNT